MPKITEELIKSLNLCWNPAKVEEANAESPGGGGTEYELLDFLKLENVSPEDRMSVALHESILPAATLREFAADCAEHVYPNISMLDSGGVLKEAIAAAKSGDSARLDEARRGSHQFTRKIARNDPKKKFIRAVQSVRGCTKADPREAAITASYRAIQAVEDNNEALWQLTRLRELVS